VLVAEKMVRPIYKLSNFDFSNDSFPSSGFSGPQKCVRQAMSETGTHDDDDDGGSPM